MFCGPLNISKTAEGWSLQINQLAHNECYATNAKLGQRGRDMGHVTYF